jgi:hypothetical protein
LIRHADTRMSEHDNRKHTLVRRIVGATMTVKPDLRIKMRLLAAADAVGLCMGLHDLLFAAAVLVTFVASFLLCRPLL